MVRGTCAAFRVLRQHEPRNKTHELRTTAIDALSITYDRLAGILDMV